MARIRPRVEGALLHETESEAPPIRVGSEIWFVWLETNQTFEYVDGSGAYIALKERSGRATFFWRAFKRQHGSSRRAYLGQSRDLTLERLEGAARALAGEEATPPP